MRPEGLCTACSATQYCSEHEPSRAKAIRQAWDAIARVEMEVLGDHVTFNSIEPILSDIVAFLTDGQKDEQP